MFFEKIHSMTKFQQPIWQIICNSNNKNNTRTLESLHIFLESNYKVIPWLKKFEKIDSLSCICASSGISTNKVQRASEQHFDQSPENRIASPKLYLLISYLLKDEFSFSLNAEFTESFSSAPQESKPGLMHHCYHFLVSLLSLSTSYT